MPAAPAGVQPGALDRQALGLLDVGHPQQLEVEILEKEATAGRPLAGVRVGGPLLKAELQKRLCFRSALGTENKNVVENSGHEEKRL